MTVEPIPESNSELRAARIYYRAPEEGFDPLWTGGIVPDIIKGLESARYL